MGARKAIKAEKIKAEKKQKAIAVLRDCPTSPRKMRLVADIIRGVEINKALGILRFSKKEASIRMEKLLKSAIANWEAKNENERLEDTKLCVKEVFVDGGRMLKRIQAAPQGRAHRIRKRSNHVTIVVDKMVTVESKHLEDHHRAHAETGYGNHFHRPSGHHHRQGRSGGRQAQGRAEEAHRQGDSDQYLRGKAS